MIRCLPVGTLCRIPTWNAGGLFCSHPYESQTSPRSEPKCSCGLGESIVETMSLEFVGFLGGKTRKDFEKMAKKNSELEEAYDVLDKLSADEKKRLEYETRQRAIRDYNIGMLTAERRGIEAGRKIGMEEGRSEGRAEGVNRINQLNIELSKRGRTEDILKAAVDKEYQEKLLKEFGLQ